MLPPLIRPASTCSSSLMVRFTKHGRCAWWCIILVAHLYYTARITMNSRSPPTELIHYPQAEHLLDWFHVTLRITVMTQMAKGLEGKDRAIQPAVLKEWE